MSNMFGGCTNLTSFSGDLSALTSGSNMFQNCTNLTSFNSDLSSLTDGNSMFQSCTNLTSFNGDLSSLTDGIEMFLNCKLDAFSVENILTTIPTYTDGSSHKITMGVQKGEAVNKFNEITGSTGDRGTYNYKGWTITLSSIQV